MYKKLHAKFVMEMKGCRQENLRNRRNELMLLFSEYLMDHQQVMEADGMDKATLDKLMDARRMMAEVCGMVEVWNNTY